MSSPRISTVPIPPSRLILFLGVLVALLTLALTAAAALHGAPAMHPWAMHYNPAPGMHYN